MHENHYLCYSLFVYFYIDLFRIVHIGYTYVRIEKTQSNYRNHFHIAPRNR